MNTEIEFTRINNDVNGNPRYVCHFLNFINDNDDKAAKQQANYKKGIYSIDLLYKIALKKAKSLGGKKYNNKKYGGGIVFQSYNITNLSQMILNAKNN